MASPILRGGNLVVTEQGIREGVRQAILPLWNTWYFLSLYANAAGRVGVRAHRLGERARPLRARQDRGTGRRADRGAGGPRHRRGVRAGARPRGGADQLVRPPLPRAVLGRRRRRDRHPAHRAGGDRPGRRAAAAADHGEGVAGADRWPVGAPDGLAGRRTSSRTTTRWWRRWTGCARWRRRRCRCARPAGCGSGCRWPGSLSARHGRGDAAAVRRHPGRRGQRQGRRAHRRRRGLRPVRGRGQRACLRAAAGWRHPEGDPRGQGGGVDGEPGRHRGGGRHHAAARGVHREARRRRRHRNRPHCPATPAWSCWTRS